MSNNEILYEISLLISLLKGIERDSSAEKVGNIYEPTHPLVNSAIYLANLFLTGNDRFENMEHIKKAGFLIYPGEQDRFGWLTGCIQLKQGVIIFG